MIIERKGNEIILRLSDELNAEEIQNIVDYINFKKIVKNSQAEESEINSIAEESKEVWWKANKSRFISK